MSHSDEASKRSPPAVAARVSLVVAVCLLLMASFAPVWFVPHVLYSYHLEHFAALYCVALAAAAAFPRRLQLELGIGLWLLAALIEGLRSTQGAHHLSGLQDWAADAAGVLAALAPMKLEAFKRERGL